MFHAAFVVAKRAWLVRYCLVSSALVVLSHLREERRRHHLKPAFG